ncbi:unnamed protein product [marine sediment metagenome]|uniref:Uncharacterized protein n=1 Tax=marine sediment metagenome TaxID=412755 RepID=X0T1E0_9ZZZZ
MPVICFFAQLGLAEGAITESSKIEALKAMSERSEDRYEHPAAQRQLAGWPADWQRQLAVALDVPAAELKKIGLGGPLLMSELWGIPLETIIEYFDEAGEV